MANAGVVSDACDSLPPAPSLHALDWLNAFVAALLTGAGPFVAVNLADRGWEPAHIGLILTASGLASLFSQVPAGELIDRIRAKRKIIAAAVAAVALGISIFGLRREFAPIFAAAVMQGSAASVLGPAIAAISLGLVGQTALAERLGRNQRFASIGGLSAAALMGIVGYFGSIHEIFFVTAIFAVPALWSLARIRAADIHYGKSCCAPDDHPERPRRASRISLFKDRRLVAFAICLFLFQLANASILPLVGETLVHSEGQRSSLVVSALIVMPQMIVAALAPWVGVTANSWGRRPLLLIGLGVVPIRAALFSVIKDPSALILVQLLDGITGATLGVLTALVVADLAQGTGRFNLAQGFVGTLSGIGASLSTAISGLVVGSFGQAAGLLGAAGVSLAAFAVLWACLPETKPTPLADGTAILGAGNKAKPVV